MLKRAFDAAVSGVALVLLSPVFALIAAWVKLDSRGPVLFRHRRVGMNFVPIDVLKFRSMRTGTIGASITSGRDARITRAGNILRATKLDELPQLWNVLCGDMSFVGPRPECAEYVERFRPDYEVLLRVRPGITDPSALAFRNEQELLGEAADPQAYYIGEVLPRKIQLSREYVECATFWTDIRLIVDTVLACFGVQDRYAAMGLQHSNESNQ